MKLTAEQITTQEVRHWQGLHLLHFHGSSCSQKVRIALAAKGLDWVSHHVDLVKSEHATSWFLGINPRGVVPVLVHDGEVHVESNDIMAYLDGLPSKRENLFPIDLQARAEIEKELAYEDSLHMDVRNVTLGFLVPRKFAEKSEETLKRYESEGPDDDKRRLEVQWWRDFARQGILPEVARASVRAYSRAFASLGPRLEGQDYLHGAALGVLDIAWFISAHRLSLAGYPLASLHPSVGRWHQRLLSRPAFAREVKSPAPLRAVIALYQFLLRVRGKSLAALISA